MKAKPTSSIKINKGTLFESKGGGSVRGFGESFTADEFTGSAFLSIPIPVTSCRDSEPHLTLDYNSNSGNGPFGLGFSLNLASVSRQTSKGTPLYSDSDTFLYANEDYLVPCFDSTGAKQSWSQNLSDQTGQHSYQVTRYRPRVEQSFHTIEYWTNKSQTDSFWRVIDDHNTMFIFGRTKQAHIVDPEDKTRIFRWLIEYVIDAHGNAQHYTYQEEDKQGINDKIFVGESKRTIGSNKYIKRICYGNPAPIQTPATLENVPGLIDGFKGKWHFEVVFDYGEFKCLPPTPPATLNPQIVPLQLDQLEDWTTRMDIFSSFEAGFEIRTRRLCRNILMFHRFDSLDGDTPVLIHATRFGYKESRLISHLSSVELVGYQQQSNGSHEAPHNLSQSNKTYSVQSLPPLAFNYVPFDTSTKPGFENILDVDGNSLVGLNSSTHHMLIDLYGEGIPGLLYCDGQSTYYREPILNGASKTNTQTNTSPALEAKTTPGNKGLLQLQFANRHEPVMLPVGQLAADASHSLSDMTGNGSLDWVITSSTSNGYYEVNPDQSWKPYRPFEKVPTEYHRNHSHLVDVTGTGLSDCLMVRNGLVYVYPNDRTRGFAPLLEPVPAPEGFPASLHSTPDAYVSFANIDGSGKSHLVRITRDKVEYWPNLGHGRFGEAIEMAISPQIEADNFDSIRVFLADLNGSGTADLVCFNVRQAIVYFNQSGNSFSNPLLVDLPSTFDQFDHISFADLFGNGNECLILSQTHPAPIQWYCDFCLSEGLRQKPYLLKQINNNIGAITTLQYRGSSQFYLQDQQQKDPDKHWITHPPFSVQVLERVEHHDLISNNKLTSRYHYRHGFYDGIEREFRGFGMVEHYDTETSDTELKGSNKSQTLTDDKAGLVDPAVTIKWFHTGSEHQNSLSSQYRNEYYDRDSHFVPLPDSSGPSPGDPEFREAQRALKGRVLRIEVYGLDDPKNKDPFTVIESNYRINLLQKKYDNAYSVFHVHPQETLHYDYERNPNDPLVSHNCVLNVDEHGYVRQTCRISYGRRSKTDLGTDPPDYEVVQTKIKASCFLQSFVEPIQDRDTCLMGFPLESQIYELTSLGKPNQGSIFRFDELASKLDTGFTEQQWSQMRSFAPPFKGQPDAQLIDWQRHYYSDEGQPPESQELAFGKITSCGLAACTKTATITAAQLKGSTQEFQKQLKDNSGFFLNDGCWWNPGIRFAYSGPTEFCLPIQIIEPLKSNQKESQITSSIVYDPCRLFFAKFIDALGNEVSGDQFDYRVLQPTRVQDINDNISEILFDPLGRVIATSHYGTQNDDGSETSHEVGFTQELTSRISVKINSVDDLVNNPASYLGSAASLFVYDDFAWINSQGEVPIRVFELTAEHYPVTDQSSADSDPNRATEVSIKYFDGFARTIQNTIRVESAEADCYLSHKAKTSGPVQELKVDQNTPQYLWLVLNRETLNNKGLPFRIYEPYFTDTLDLIPLDSFGSKLPYSTRFYDPLGRERKVITPKGYLLENQWTPWSITHQDENDCFACSPYNLVNQVVPVPSGCKKDVPSSYKQFEDQSITGSSSALLDVLDQIIKTCSGTPTIAIHDNLGHTIVQRQLYRQPGDKNLPKALNTIHQTDLKGHLLSSADPRLSTTESKNLKYTPDLVGQILKIVSTDAGTRWLLRDAMGNQIYWEDSRNFQFFREYDDLHRPLTLHVKGGDAETMLDHMVERTVYGETIDEPGTSGTDKSKQKNLRGQIFQHYDQSGKLEFNSGYSIAGYPLSKSLQPTRQSEKLINWTTVDTSNLESIPPFITSFQYDAIGRMIQRRDAVGNIHEFSYYLHGELSEQSLTLKTNSAKQDLAPLVSQIKYNAHGSKVSEYLGKATKTTYEYDPRTFFLNRIITTKQSDAKEVLQDLNYEYDPAGNLLSLRNAATSKLLGEKSGTINQAEYTYDSIYRLTNASGVEKSPSTSAEPLLLPPQKQTSVRPYQRSYRYDDGGNLRQINDGKNVHVEMLVSPKSNHAISGDLARSLPAGTDSSNVFADADGNKVVLKHTVFDPNGNQQRSLSIENIQWNYNNQISGARLDAPDKGQGSETYVYNSKGKRTRKSTILKVGNEQVVSDIHYLDDLEVHIEGQRRFHFLRIITGDDQNLTIHQPVDASGEAQGEPELIFSLHNHIRSVTLETDAAGEPIRFEEFYPYGGTALLATKDPTALPPKRYRYSSKELDANTDWYYYGARYYSPMFGRWLSPDPAWTVDGLNLYAFVSGNPITHFDNDGHNEHDYNLRNRKRKRDHTGVNHEQIENIGSSKLRQHRRVQAAFGGVRNILVTKFVKETGNNRHVLYVVARSMGQVKKLQLRREETLTKTGTRKKRGHSEAVMAAVLEIGKIKVENTTYKLSEYRVERLGVSTNEACGARVENCKGETVPLLLKLAGLDHADFHFFNSYFGSKDGPGWERENIQRHLRMNNYRPLEDDASESASEDEETTTHLVIDESSLQGLDLANNSTLPDSVPAFELPDFIQKGRLIKRHRKRFPNG